MDTAVSRIERSYFPDHVIALAHSLLMSGYTNRAVERAVKERYPGEAPSRETIRQWDIALAKSCNEELETREQRIMAQSDDIIATGLQQLKEQPEQILKHLMTVNAVRGTMADKQIKRQDTANPDNRGNTFVFINTPVSDIQSIKELTE